MMTLLNEFMDACDTSKTSPKKSLQPLVDKILSMVSPDEMNDFFASLDGAMGYRFNGRYEKTLADIIRGGNDELKEYAVKFVRSDKGTKKELINRYPDLVGHIVDKSEAREFWMKFLGSVRNRVAVLARMIMERLIDPSEQDEAIRKVIDYSFDNNEGMGDVSDEEILALKAAGFFQALKEEYFNSDYTSKNAYNCGRNKYDFFYGYTAHLPIDKDWIKTLADIFSQAVYPTVWLDIYKEHFLGDEKYKKRFDEVVRENGITLPSVMIV